MSDPLDTYEQWTGEKHVYDDKVVKGAFPKVTFISTERHDLLRLVNEIKEVVYAYSGGISVTEAIGAVELAKLEILKEQE
jgi:hypothetical protein